MRLGDAISVGYQFDSPHCDGLDLGPLATCERHHRPVCADLQDLGAQWSYRALTVQPLQLGALERHIRRASDFGVLAHTGFTDLHSREVGQLFGGPLERHPRAQVHQILLQAWTQQSRQQLQFLIQGEKDRLHRPGSARNRVSSAPRRRHAS